MAAKPQHISEIYASQLEEFRQGYALWSPSGPEGADEIDIGDVGYILEGQFVEMFKGKYARDDSQNARNLRKHRIPLSHEPLPERAYSNLLRAARDMEPNMYSTKSMKHDTMQPQAGVTVPGVAGVNLGYKLITTEEKAAFVCITYKAIKTIAENSITFVQYVKQHHSAWLEHAKNELGIDLRGRSIIIVHGFVKTVEWIVGASRGGSVSQGASVKLEGGVPAVAGRVALELESNISKTPQMFYLSGPEKRFSHSHSRSPSPSASSFRDSLMTGSSHSRNFSQHTLEVPSPQMPIPKVAEPPEESDWNQCIFLRYFQVKWKIGTYPLYIKANAGPHQLPRDPDAGEEGSSAVAAGDGDSDSEVEANPPVQQTNTWLDVLLDYILQHSDADVAIACHGDIYTLVSEEETIEDFASFLEQRNPMIDVDEDRVAHLSLVDLVVQQRERELRMVRPPIKKDDDAMDTDDDDDRDDDWRAETRQVVDGELTLRSSPKHHRWPHLVLCGKDGDSGYISTMALSPDNKLILAGCADGITQVWSFETGEIVEVFNGPHTELVWAVGFSSDGKLIATGDTEGVLCVRAGTNDLPFVQHGEDGPVGVQFGDVLFNLEGHTQDITAVAFSPDGKWFVSGSVECTVNLWPMSLERNDGPFPITLSPQHTVKELSTHVSHAVFTPDSKRLILCGDTIASVWDLESGRITAKMSGHTGPIWSLALSHDGERVITGGEDNTCRIWETNSGTELVILAEHTGPVWSVAWSPDDKYVVSGSHDLTAVICDSYTGERIQDFKEDISGATPVTWLSDDVLCTGTADGPVKLWDAKSGECVATFYGHDDKVKEIYPTNDLRNVLSFSDDGSIRIWNVSQAMRLVA
ncbi:WD40-repeat-containing domain protein [Irpex rosettiformis]|uniref:WD40-repeat-containing domain protein n=1 Tax=Irpex rosettiformis TaxID=378272 RepID=A0ACB8UEH9_9APHY|nr:WD40-repeat-containing domain protein [Irpex rosettiformis]